MLIAAMQMESKWDENMTETSTVTTRVANSWANSLATKLALSSLAMKKATWWKETMRVTLKDLKNVVSETGMTTRANAKASLKASWLTAHLKAPMKQETLKANATEMKHWVNRKVLQTRESLTVILRAI